MRQDGEGEGEGFLFLKPGQIAVSSEPLLVTTLLGSCVAVTMYSARLQLGGICHAQLPSCGSSSPCTREHLPSGKYVDCSIMQMLDRFSARGASSSDIQAKVFGGSDMFDGHGRNRSVGRKNIEMALLVLERESIRVVGQDLGGGRGRKIIFHAHSGEVFLKRLRKSGVC